MPKDDKHLVPAVPCPVLIDFGSYGQRRSGAIPIDQAGAESGVFPRCARRFWLRTVRT